MTYEGIIYRPPSEAYSFILQVTIGCSHNRCTFCNMYKSKHFSIRSLEEIKADIDEAATFYGTQIDRVFLADGDALILPTATMIAILNYIKKKMPWVARISSYAAPKDLLAKKPDELQEIYQSGLNLLYMGAESGDDVTLTKIQKGVTATQIVEAGKKAHEAGFQLSITLISGLSGTTRLQEHAIESAYLISQIKPKYLGFLTLMLENGTKISEEVKEGSLVLLTPDEVMEEMELFLTHIDSEGTIFRANHASNYISLRGTLNRDKDMLLAQIKEAREKLIYRKEWNRRL